MFLINYVSDPYYNKYKESKMIGFILFAHFLFISIQEMCKSTDTDSMVVNLQKKIKNKKCTKE